EEIAPVGTGPAHAQLKIVGIGASAGGLEAFTELLGSLPAKAEAAYVLVQHLDPTHRSLLSELLGRATALPVREIVNKTRAEANQIYVIPPNCDLTIAAGILKLTPRKKNEPARSIDHFLQSLASDQKGNAIGVILSGAGSDGAKGLKAIKHAGGITFAQDADSSKYDSMPRSAVATGCVDFVLPPGKIATEIGRLILQPGSTKSRAAANARRRGSKPTEGSRNRLLRGATGARWPTGPEDTNLRKLFALLRSKTGLDFSLYRPSTITRRLNRRLVLHKVADLESYLRILRESPAETEALYQDLLINVTSFFRNPSVFEVLKKKIFPRLAKNHSNGDSLRFWVTGCSTGQEAYALAMAYVEFAERAQIALPAQIFATDVNATVLEHARLGRYTKAHVSGVSAERLQRFFQKENEFYRVQKPIRDMVIFAQHNLLSDPPFTRVDMISCRNMLIYLESALQERIIPSFHYSLRAGGFLVLGASESVGQFTNLFETLERRHKIYQKKPGSSWVRYERQPMLPAAKRVAAGPAVRHAELNTNDAFREADRVSLAKYAPSAVLVNETGEILQFRGDAQKYLELPRGKASFHLLKMARDGLALPLQKGLERARKENRPVREKDVRYGDRRATIDLEIMPLKNLPVRCFLVFFEKPAVRVPDPKVSASAEGAKTKVSKDESRRMGELRRDFLETRAHLTALQEEHETSVEELQASNEEVQSANEELQSLNEELETSNEELESA
ncbi:MAG TPA: chemotaxis protein CheB, partial [Chthoniobacteraceae bacterium]